MVAELVEDMCDYVNENWEAKSAIHLAAYIMWRLNWIHPFADGNGRLSRFLLAWESEAEGGPRLFVPTNMRKPVAQAINVAWAERRVEPVVQIMTEARTEAWQLLNDLARLIGNHCQHPQAGP